MALLAHPPREFARLGGYAPQCGPPQVFGGPGLLAPRASEYVVEPMLPDEIALERLAAALAVHPDVFVNQSRNPRND